MGFVAVIEGLLPIVLPIIQKLIDSAVVPILKRKAYERFDGFANDMIQDLTNLKTKSEQTDNPIKKAAHEEGLKLGADALKAIGEKLIKASEVLSE